MQAPIDPELEAHALAQKAARSSYLAQRKARVVDPTAERGPCTCLVYLEETRQMVTQLMPRGMRAVVRIARSERVAVRLRRVTCLECELAVLRRLCARERKGGPSVPTGTRLPRVAEVVAELAEEVGIARDEVLELLGCGRTVDEILSMAEAS